MESTVQSQTKINLICPTHGNCMGVINKRNYLVCPECGKSDMGEDLRVRAKTPCEPFITPMKLTLTHENHVLMEIDVWYLMLSAILRAEAPFSLNRTFEEAVLTAEVEVGGQVWRFSIPQPPEFIEDKEKV